MAYSDKEISKIIIDVCNRIMEGEAVRNILKEKDMPAPTTFFKWIDESNENLEHYARANRIRAEMRFDKIREFAKADCSYTMTDEKGNTYKRTDSAKVQQQRVKIDAEKWCLSRENPKKYGDKIQVDQRTKITELPATIEELNEEIEEIEREGREAED